MTTYCHPVYYTWGKGKHKKERMVVLCPKRSRKGVYKIGVRYCTDWDAHYGVTYGEYPEDGPVWCGNYILAFAEWLLHDGFEWLMEDEFQRHPKLEEKLMAAFNTTKAFEAVPEMTEDGKFKGYWSVSLAPEHISIEEIEKAFEPIGLKIRFSFDAFR